LCGHQRAIATYRSPWRSTTSSTPSTSTARGTSSTVAPRSSTGNHADSAARSSPGSGWTANLVLPRIRLRQAAYIPAARSALATGERQDVAVLLDHLVPQRAVHPTGRRELPPPL